MKMRTQSGKWIIDDGKKTVVFDNSKDAWLYITYMLLIRASIKLNTTKTPAELYPVRSLVPHPVRGF